MDNEIKNKEDGLIIKNKKVISANVILDEKLRNNLPPGTYLIKDGKLIPNDEATKKRFKKQVKK